MTNNPGLIAAVSPGTGGAMADLGTVFVPVVPSLDDNALKNLAEQVRATIRQAVLDGITDALLEYHEHPTEER